MQTVPSEVVPDLIAAVRAAKRIVDVALPKFDWGKSALDAEAITALNEGCISIDNAARKLDEIEAQA